MVSAGFRIAAAVAGKTVPAFLKGLKQTEELVKQQLKENVTKPLDSAQKNLIKESAERLKDAPPGTLDQPWLRAMKLYKKAVKGRAERKYDQKGGLRMPAQEKVGMTDAELLASGAVKRVK